MSSFVPGTAGEGEGEGGGGGEGEGGGGGEGKGKGEGGEGEGEGEGKGEGEGEGKGEGEVRGEIKTKYSQLSTAPHSAVVRGRESGKTSRGRQGGMALHMVGRRTQHTVLLMPPHDQPQTGPDLRGVWWEQGQHWTPSLPYFERW